MKFCPQCNNLFYNKIVENKLHFQCNYCSYTKEFEPETDSNEIYLNSYENDNISYREYINKYTHLDPTLPRVTNIICPNSECASQENEEIREVIYIKYNLEKMNYIYLCCNCHTKWKSIEN